MLRIFRARQRPILLFSPLIFSHHENLNRLFFLHPVSLSLQQPVVPTERHLISIRRQFVTKFHRAHLPAARLSSVPSDRNHQPLPVPRRFRARLRLQPHIIFQRAAKKNVVPRAYVVYRHLDLRVMVFDRQLLPVLVEIRIRQPILEIRRDPFPGRRFEHRVGNQRQHLRPAQRIVVFFRAPTHGVFRQSARPRFVEPLLERPALIRPPVMIIRRRHVRANPRPLRRLRHRPQELRPPPVLSPEPPHLPLRLWNRRLPPPHSLPVP